MKAVNDKEPKLVISLETLKKHGWTKAMIEEFLGGPDFVGEYYPNGKWRRKHWLAERVDAAEKVEKVAARLKKFAENEARRKAAYERESRWWGLPPV